MEKLFLSYWAEALTGAWVYRQLRRRYAEEHRSYHDFAHVEHCVAAARGYFQNQPDELFEREAMLALFFHDAIYRPGSKFNERKSAELWERFAWRSEQSNDTIVQVSRLVRSTSPGVSLNSPGARLVHDADRAIFGAGWSEYQTYAENVREEFSCFPSCLYRQGRVQFLRQELSGESLFRTDYFLERFECSARENLERELSLLSRGRAS